MSLPGSRSIPRKLAAQGGKRWTGGIFGALYKPLRQRIARRVLLTIGACILLAVTVLVSTGTAGTLWRQARSSWLEQNAPTLIRATLTPQPANQRTLPSDWQQQPLTLPNPMFTGISPRRMTRRRSTAVAPDRLTQRDAWWLAR